MQLELLWWYGPCYGVPGNGHFSGEWVYWNTPKRYNGARNNVF